MMPYRGERLGVVLGVEVRRLTDAERASTGGEEQLYQVVGHSHWSPDWFFAQRVDELEQELAIARAAAVMIGGAAEELADLERHAVSGQPMPTDWGDDNDAKDGGGPCDEWPAWVNSIVSGEADPS
ncbi:MAG: hypothetical protein ACYCV7_10660 [Acidimicrobiales bacterium]